MTRRYRITSDDVLPALLPHLNLYADEVAALVEYELWRRDFAAGAATLNGRALHEIKKSGAVALERCAKERTRARRARQRQREVENEAI